MMRYSNTPNSTKAQDTVTITRFTSRAASSKAERTTTLPELASAIETRSAKSKDALPWIKLATFGDAKSDRGSYRTNANVVSVTGVEGDYDGGTMPPEEARDRLTKAGIEALIYTTPSHSPENPRWRVLAPFSTSLSPDAREGHMARLNGVLDGGFDPASFTLSQAFYAGNVEGGTKVRTYITEGRHIDTASDLDAGAIWKGGATEPPQAGDSTGQKTGLPFMSIRDALLHIPNITRDRESWLILLAGLHHETDGSAAGLALAHEWSAPHPSYDPDATDTLWQSLRRGGGKVRTAASIIKEAERHGWRDTDRMLSLITDDMVDPVDPIAEMTGQAPEPSRLTFLTPDDCESLPAREYVIKGLVAQGDVACIVGAPGAGKSLLGPRLGYAVAQGKEVFGRRVRQGGVFYVAAEDAHGMRGRVKALRQHHGSADAFNLVDGVTNLLATNAPDLLALKQALESQRPALVVIDTLALAFPGLEENDAKGMGRVVSVARSLTKWGAAVVLIHHDTKAGDGLPRGHSILNGALDVSLSLKRNGGIVRIQLSKNRNGSTDCDLAFAVKTVALGTDEDGDTITTAMCEELDAGTRPQPDQHLSPSAKAAFAIFADLSEDGPVEETGWRDAAIEGRTVSASEDRDNRRKTFKRAIEELTRKGKVIFADGHFTMTDSRGEVFTDDMV